MKGLAAYSKQRYYKIKFLQYKGTDMTAELHHITKYYCAACVAMMVLASAGCDIPLLPQCNNGPGNAINTLSCAGAVFTLKDSSDYDNPTYSMTQAQPDTYLRWKTTGGDFGITTIFCLVTYWNATFGADWQPVVIWAGSATPVCGEISSLKVLSGKVTADFKLKREYGNTLAASSPLASLVLALGGECPTGKCSGTIMYGQCYSPYAGLDSDNASYASLPGVDLNYASMSSANLSRADLTGASLSHATLDGADLTEAKLSQAALSSTVMAGATLRQATLDGACLDNATLTNADLRDATLNNAVLSYADLTGADMHNVEISGALVHQTIAPDGATVDNVTALQMHSLIP